jgi:F0F1-type ATP synthase gamma subunit
MSKLKEIKEKIGTFSQCEKICNSMSNLSIVRMITFKTKSIILREKINLLGLIMNSIDKNIFEFKGKKNTFVFFSDFGYCGDFNNYKLEENYILLGLKSKTSSVSTNNFEEFRNAIINRIEDNLNFEILVNNIKGFTKSFTLKKFLAETIYINNKKISINYGTIFEINKQSIQKAYLNIFLEYVWTYGLYQENYFRNKIMNNALDNTKDLIKHLTNTFNKTKQLNITNEISLIVSCE